ncbi:MAG: hypothetical protein GQ527_07265 [Bacteroidales bacterium]|nr:hypothetical protein [Bacteroidales bacterium]
MKLSHFILLGFIGTGLLMWSCGGSQLSENNYLGKLPAISEKYQIKLDIYKEKSELTTDINRAYKYDKKFLLTKEEANIVMGEYIASQALQHPIPFRNLAANKFDVLSIEVKSAAYSGMVLTAHVKIKEDLINKYGGFERTFTAYIKAVDGEGKMIGSPTVLASELFSRGPFISGSEKIISGTIGNLRYFEKFENIVFISKEEYSANQ